MPSISRIKPLCSIGRYRYQSQSSKPKVTRISFTVNNNEPNCSREPYAVDTTSYPLAPTAPSKPSTLSANAATVSEKSQLPPSLHYVRELMNHYKAHVVLTQMGSFYELYFEHANAYAPQLNISLTSKTYSFGKVPFAGFPVSQLDRHLKILVNNYGHSVVISDQFKRDTIADNDLNKIYRRVTRIVTPGTFIDEAFENLQKNTYLLNIEFPENCMKKLANPEMKIGLCWCDISTGEISVQEILLRDLASAITRIQPTEILLDEGLVEFSLESGHWYPELVELKKYFIKYQRLIQRRRTMDTFYGLFTAGNTQEGINQLNLNFRQLKQKEAAALRNILIYVSEHLPDFSMNFQIPQRQLATSIMQIDSRTSAALELHTSVRDNRKKGTLISTIRRTVTSVGTRLLGQWLSGPSMILKEIKTRQKMVKFFKDRNDCTETLRYLLQQTHDLARILQKFSFGSGGALEIIQLARSIQVAIDIGSHLQRASEYSGGPSKKMIETVVRPLKFDAKLISDVLTGLNEEELARSQKIEKNAEMTDNSNGVQEEVEASTANQPEEKMEENWIVNADYSPRLGDLHRKYAELRDEQCSLQSVYEDYFIDNLGCKGVLLKKKQNGDYVLRITGGVGPLRKMMEMTQQKSFHVLQKSSQVVWLIDERWTQLGDALETTVLKIRKEETSIMNEFKKRFIEKTNDVRAISEVLAYLDVLSSFAVLAHERNLVCPIIDQSERLEIVDGRHLVVEDAVSKKSLEKFTPNDCVINGGELWIVSGPNMGGKSTFLRQNAIIVLLAQMGCFVPCKSARIGLVDKIFSRVGAADDLYNEMSTFMVEMVETSFILKGATSRSLAILDEIGRGTSGNEGVSIAFATLKYLLQNNGCRSLFATHFGRELNDILQRREKLDLLNKIRFCKSGIVETSEGNFYYDHRLKPGICQSSDALRVAKKAGFPNDALEIAKNILAWNDAEK